MRFKEPASRAPKPIKDGSVEPISDLEQEQEQVYGLKVCFIYYIKRSAAHHRDIKQDLGLDMDLEIGANPLGEPQFVEGSSVRC